MTVSHRALDEAEADLREAIRSALSALGSYAPTQLTNRRGHSVRADLTDCAEACIALHRRELSRALAGHDAGTLALRSHLRRAVGLLRLVRDFDTLTRAERACYQNDIDELVAALAEPSR